MIRKPLLAHPGNVEVAAEDGEVLGRVRGRIFQVFPNEVVKNLKVLKADAIDVSIPKYCIAVLTTDSNAMNATLYGDSMDNV